MFVCTFGAVVILEHDPIGFSFDINLIGKKWRKIEFSKTLYWRLFKKTASVK